MLVERIPNYSDSNVLHRSLSCIAKCQVCAAIEMNLPQKEISEWLLLGILLYICFIILIICIRYCVTHRLLCKNSTRGVHCIHICRFCHPEICCLCGTIQSARNVFCCQREHTLYEPSCCGDIFPEFEMRCFKPQCREIRCICCECSIETVPPKKIFVVEQY